MLDKQTTEIIKKDMEFLNKIAIHKTQITIPSLFKAYKKANPRKAS